MTTLTRSEFLTLSDLEALLGSLPVVHCVDCSRSVVRFDDFLSLAGSRGASASDVARDLRSLQDRHGLVDVNLSTGYSIHGTGRDVLAAGPRPA